MTSPNIEARKIAVLEGLMETRNNAALAGGALFGSRMVSLITLAAREVFTSITSLPDSAFWQYQDFCDVRTITKVDNARGSFNGSFNAWLLEQKEKRS